MWSLCNCVHCSNRLGMHLWYCKGVSSKMVHVQMVNVTNAIPIPHLAFVFLFRLFSHTCTLARVARVIFYFRSKTVESQPCCSACRASAPPGCPGGCSCPPGTSSSPGPRSTTATGSNLTTAFDQCWAPAGRDKWSFSFKMKYVCYYFMKENPRDLNYIPRICWGNITNQRYYFK